MKKIILMMACLSISSVFATTELENRILNIQKTVKQIHSFVNNNPKIKLSKQLKNQLESYYREIVSIKASSTKVKTHHLQSTHHSLLALMATYDENYKKQLLRETNPRLNQGAVGSIIGKLSKNGDEQSGLSGRLITLYDASGDYVSSTQSDSLGRFFFHNINTEDYILIASDYYRGFITTMYNEVPCAGGLGIGCLPHQANLVSVEPDEYTEIEITLLQNPTMNGTITSNTNTALSSTYAEIYDGQFNFIEKHYIRDAGEFSFSVNYIGEVYVQFTSSNHTSQIYNGINCIETCDLSMGTPMTLSEDNNTALGSIELLSYRGIYGQVLDSSTQTPIEDDSYSDAIYIFNTDLELHRIIYQINNGSWSLSALPPSDYHIAAKIKGYNTTFYPDFKCPESDVYDCLNSNRETITHLISDDTTDINIYAEKAASISGTVFNHQDEDYSNITVYLYDHNGDLVQSTYQSEGYSFTGLLAGTYYLLGLNHYSSNFNGLNTLYGGQVCVNYENPEYICDDVTSGTAIHLSEGQTIENIDFSLQAGAKISGQVQNTNNQGINATVTAYRQLNDGSYIGISEDLSNWESYTIEGLTTGNYKLIATRRNHEPMLYNNVQCTPWPCQMELGTAINLTNNNAHAQNKNFNLSPHPTVTFNYNQISEYGRLKVYDATNGDYVDSYTFYPSDQQIALQLPPGNYKFLFEFEDNDKHVSHYLGGPNCPANNQCQFDQGTTVTLSSNQNKTYNVMFDDKFAINFSVEHQANVGSQSALATIYQNNNPIFSNHIDDEETFYIPSTGNIKLQVDLPGYYSQIFNEINCLDNCQISQGNNINAQLNQSTNITMTLSAIQRVNGVIRDHLNAPLTNHSISLYRLSNNHSYHLGFTHTDENGRYTFEGGLSENTDYYVRANKDDTHFATVNGGGVCIGACTSDVISVFTINQQQEITKNITLKKKGSLTVNNISLSNGDVAQHLTAYIYPIDSTYNTQSHLITTPGQINNLLVNRESFKLTFSYQNRYTVYPGIDCGSQVTLECLSQGETLELPAGESLTLNDPVVNTGGRLLITLLNSDNESVASTEVKIYDSNYNIFRNEYTDDNGLVEFSNLDPGAYYVITNSESNFRYKSTLYPDVVCDGGLGVGCIFSDGQVIDIAMNEELQLSMSLSENPYINVSMTESFTGNPVSDFSIRVFDHQYDQIDQINATNNKNVYLPPGSYYFLVGKYDYQYSTWPNHSCDNHLISSCEYKQLVTIGSQANQPIEISSLIDSGFYYEVIDGRSNSPIEGAVVDIWRLGNHYESSLTNASGRASMKGLSSTRTYQFSTDIGINDNIYNEVYNNIQCPEGPAAYGLCDFSQGEEVSIDSSVPFPQIIRFELNGDPIFDNGFEQN